MNKILTTVVIAACLIQVQCKGQSLYKKVRFDVNVQDDNNIAIANADTHLVYGHYVDTKSVSYKGKTDVHGNYSAEDTVINDTVLWVNKDGYYPVRLNSLQASVAAPLRQNERLDIKIIMRQIKTPIALCGKVVNRAIPEQNKPIGYDLLIGDWVKPYGKGDNGDFFVSCNNKCDGFKDGRKLDELIKLVKDGHLNNPSSKESYFDGLKRFYEKEQDYTYEDGAYQSMGHWQGKIQITFPNADEGITEVKDGFHSYSELTMPHEAPENGYQKDWSREEDNAVARLTSSEIGYFLRTRVKHDEKVKIVSANYSKIVTDFNFDPRGRLEFSYLFNPTPNDCNLEFDPKKNLFKNLEFREEIRKP
jgi:hypothetical protein